MTGDMGVFSGTVSIELPGLGGVSMREKIQRAKAAGPHDRWQCSRSTLWSGAYVVEKSPIC